jgi:hypothetical protein
MKIIKILIFLLLVILLIKYYILKLLILSVFSKNEGLKKAKGKNQKNSIN